MCNATIIESSKTIPHVPYTLYHAPLTEMLLCLSSAACTPALSTAAHDRSLVSLLAPCFFSCTSFTVFLASSKTLARLDFGFSASVRCVFVSECVCVFERERDCVCVQEEEDSSLHLSLSLSRARFLSLCVCGQPPCCLCSTLNASSSCKA